MKKITKSTFKSFLKKNDGKLFIQHISDLDAMTDGVQHVPSDKRKFVELKKKVISDADYILAQERNTYIQNTLGYQGVWLVDSSRNSFNTYEDDRFQGIEVYNCCGSFIVAIQRN